MNEKAFQSLQWAIDTAELMPVDRMDVQQSTRDGHAKFLQEAREELANARKLLEAAHWAWIRLLQQSAFGLADDSDLLGELELCITACRDGEKPECLS